jgi:hypothetical protein
MLACLTLVTILSASLNVSADGRNDTVSDIHSYMGTIIARVWLNNVSNISSAEVIAYMLPISTFVVKVPWVPEQNAYTIDVMPGLYRVEATLNNQTKTDVSMVYSGYPSFFYFFFYE